MKIFKINKKLIAILAMVVTAAPGFAGNKGGDVKKLGKNSAYVHYESLDANNIRMYFENNGNIQSPDNWSVEYPNGSGKTAIFAAGFAFSGYIDGDLSTAWMASASRIEDWQPGGIAANGEPQDPNLPSFKVYKYTKGDPVPAYWPADLGADFNDADGDGVYNASNGDTPKLLGDQMVWYIINDGVIPANRGLSGSKRMGVEAQVTGFMYRQSNDLGNVAYLIYKFINKGGKQIDNAIFSVWSDPDLGDSEDDLVGVDADRSLAYCYNETNNDKTYGSAPPAAGYDFFLGPREFTGNTADTVWILGKPFVGYKQLVMDSFVKYVRGRDDLPDPDTIDEARYYQEGYRYDGRPYDPTSEGKGGNASMDPRVVHPGYPETGEGWLDAIGGDRRMMINTKPFKMEPGDTQIIVVGYMVGQGSDNLQSVAKIRQVDDFAQKVFNANFKVAGPPPPPKDIFARVDATGAITLTFKTAETFNDVQTDDLENKKVFKGYKIYQYRTGQFQETVDGVANKKLLAQIDKNDGYAKIYQFSADGLDIKLVYESKQANRFVNDDDYKLPESYFNFKIEKDLFTNYSFIPGETYYFGVSSFNIEVNKIIKITSPADPSVILGWKHPNEPISESGENKFSFSYKIDSGNEGVVEAVPGSKYVKQLSGATAGNVIVDMVDVSSAKKGLDYVIDFRNTSDNTLVWRIKDSKDSVRLDNISYYSTGMTQKLVDGLSVRVALPAHKITGRTFTDSLGEAITPIYSDNALRTNTGYALLAKSSAATSGGYTWKDQTGGPVLFSGIDERKVRSIQIEFSKEHRSLAYRYFSKVNHTPKNFSPQPYQPKLLTRGPADSIVWAGFTKTFTSDQPNNGRILATRKPGVGIVSVPFRAWDISNGVDNRRQLKVSLIETFKDKDQANLYLNGKWDAKADALETIVISTDTYDANLNMPQDSTQLDKYMQGYFIKNDLVIGDNLFLWDGAIDTTSSAYNGSRLTFNTNAFTPEHKFLLSGFSSDNTYYEDNKKDLFENLTIYPNPYMGDNPQEISANTRFVSMLNVPKRATIRIYNLAGELVRKLEKNDNLSLFRWDLKNSTGLYVASGIYLIQVDAPGVGSKVLKFALIQRQEQIGVF